MPSSYSTLPVAMKSTPVSAALATITSPIRTGAFTATPFSAFMQSKIFPFGTSVLVFTGTVTSFPPSTVTVLVTILVGVALSAWWAPAIGTAATAVGNIIMWATDLQPFLMGVIVSVVIGVALTLPISSAAICAAFGLTGLAGGAAVAGCCANMVGFAVLSFRENGWGGLVSQGLGTSMLQMGNILKNPRVWLPAILTSAVTGPLATCVFRLEMNGPPVSSGMGTCGLVGQIGVWTGWLSPSERALANGAAAVAPGAMDWLGLILISFVLPAVLCWAFGLLFRRIGWIKPGDLTLQ